jgi:hypothetical protein
MHEWKRLESGRYASTGRKSGVEYEAQKLSRNDYEPHPGESARWLLFADDECVDAAETFGQLKELVENSES